MKKYLSSLLAILMTTASLYAQEVAHTNTAQANLTKGGPDLVISSVSISNSSLLPRLNTDGSIKLPLKVTIHNHGDELARSPFGVHINLEIDGEKIDAVSIPKLSSGQFRTFDMTVNIPLSLTGEKILFSSTVDTPIDSETQRGPKGGFIRETNEENNSHSVYLEVPAFDLIAMKTL